MNELLLARQPIHSPNLTVLGYELLFRSTGTPGPADAEVARIATAHFASRLLFDIGLDRLVGRERAFINATMAFVADVSCTALPKERVVLELGADEILDPTNESRVLELRQLGYKFALEVQTLDELSRCPLSFFDYVKLDAVALDQKSLQIAARSLQGKSIQLIATKIEHIGQFDACKQMGFHYFQGFFFCRPGIIKGQQLKSNRVAITRLMSQLQNSDLAVAELEQLLRADTNLCYKLLRFVNSAAVGRNRTVASIREALVLVGMARIKSWTAVLLLSQLSDKIDELTGQALLRAHMCEGLAKATNSAASDQYFLVGLLSVLDAMLGYPIAQAIESLPVSNEVREALIAHARPLGAALNCVLAYESHKWSEVRFGTLTIESIHDVFVNSIVQNNQLLQQLETPQAA